MLSHLEKEKPEIRSIKTDFILLFSIEHMLHTAIEAAVNISEHIIAGLNLGHPDEAKESFKILSKNGIISEELAKKLDKAPGMRNILVHEYADIDPDQVIKVISEGKLNDLKSFASEITAFLDRQES